MIRGTRSIVLILMAAWLAAGCVESEFHLAKDSRLPGWFEIPEGAERKDLDVVLSYYTTGPAKLNLRDVRNAKSLKTIKAIHKHHPDYWDWAQSDWHKRSHPGYVALSAEGITEIIEHRIMEPIFYVSNESAVQYTINSGNTHKK